MSLDKRGSRHSHMHTEGWPCEDRQKMQSLSHRSGHQGKSALLGSLSCRLLDPRIIKESICYISCLFCGDQLTCFRRCCSNQEAGAWLPQCLVFSCSLFIPSAVTSSSPLTFPSFLCHYSSLQFFFRASTRPPLMGDIVWTSLTQPSICMLYTYSLVCGCMFTMSFILSYLIYSIKLELRWKHTK